MDFPKSVPNVGLVGGQFVDEDQLGGTPGSLIPSAWGNAVTQEVLNVITAAELVPQEGINNQLAAAIQTLVRVGGAGVAGASVSARMSVPSASLTATFTAEEIVVKVENGGQGWVLKDFNKTINLGITGPGGIDVGPVPTTGFVGIYAIYNPTSGASALLAVNGNFLLPNCYPAFNLTQGYKASALVSVWPVNSSGQLVAGFQCGRRITFQPVSVLSATSLSASLTSLAIGGGVPRNAKTLSGTAMLGAASGSGGLSMQLAADAAGTGLQTFGGYVSTNQGVPGTFVDLPLITQQTLFHRETNSQSAAGFTVSINVMEYEI
ncbi:hypothetical protein V8U11_06795 [Pseudomonas chlororaphis]|uniref:hypothetical protein n=1 Tax=Pseudomonas chlororaphis TaxID=587753 RepID=UPI0030CE9037